MSVTTRTNSAPARSRAETRKRLLAAGAALFTRDGLHAATSAQIARRAGVAAGTFYLHFKDKQDLFRAIVFDALEQLRARLDRVTASAGNDPRAAVRARTAEMLAFAEKHRSGVRLLFGRDREAADLSEDVLNDLLPGVEAKLRQSIANGDGPPGLDAKVAAQAFLAMWTRVVAWWIEEPRRAAREAVIETLTALYPAPSGSAHGARTRAVRPARRGPGERTRTKRGGEKRPGKQRGGNSARRARP